MTEPYLAGIDCGFSRLTESTGLLWLTPSAHRDGRCSFDFISRNAFYERGKLFDLLVVDGPLLPGMYPEYELSLERRLCERLFVKGEFRTRCKPGESHYGHGLALRRSGGDALSQFAGRVREHLPIPKVAGAKNIVESFPNAVMGLLLEPTVFDALPGVSRQKFDELYDYAIAPAVRLFERFKPYVGRWSEHPTFWGRIASATRRDHEERAALVCGLMAMCIHEGRYVAVGEPRGGYLFLPPFALWHPWAVRALQANIRLLLAEEPEAAIEVWSDGVCQTLHAAHSELQLKRVEAARE
ncbi:hypothetical protein [Paenibacillus koleovorans]|uniref:hypothetical protein n=1 Tax=Paenibacillus koleovorans TaxID=121608 RepID=UPI000FD88199|nr:hypothetical protein [Paenibacillus koleovorans]